MTAFVVLLLKVHHPLVLPLKVHSALAAHYLVNPSLPQVLLLYPLAFLALLILGATPHHPLSPVSLFVGLVPLILLANLLLLNRNFVALEAKILDVSSQQHLLLIGVKQLILVLLPNRH